MILGVAGSNPVGRPMFDRMYFVYILVCLKTGRSYVGHTDNLIRRFNLHKTGGTRTTREKLIDPIVIHWVACPTRGEAMRRERYYKSGSGNRVKREIIEAQLQMFRAEG